MTQVAVVLSDAMISTKPCDVELICEFGQVAIRRESHHPEGMYFSGTGVIIQGPADSIRNWLKPYSGIWSYVGSPMMEQFEIVHIK